MELSSFHAQCELLYESWDDFVSLVESPWKFTSIEYVRTTTAGANYLKLYAILNNVSMCKPSVEYMVEESLELDTLCQTNSTDSTRIHAEFHIVFDPTYQIPVLLLKLMLSDEVMSLSNANELMKAIRTNKYSRNLSEVGIDVHHYPRQALDKAQAEVDFRTPNLNGELHLTPIVHPYLEGGRDEICFGFHLCSIAEKFLPLARAWSLLSWINMFSRNVGIEIKDIRGFLILHQKLNQSNGK